MRLEVSLISIVNLIQVRDLLLQIFLVRAEALEASGIVTHLVFEAISTLETLVVVIICIEHDCRCVSSNKKDWNEAVPGLNFTLLERESLFRICVRLTSMDRCFESAMRLFEFRLELVSDYICTFCIELGRQLFVLVFWYGVFVSLLSRAH